MLKRLWAKGLGRKDIIGECSNGYLEGKQWSDAEVNYKWNEWEFIVHVFVEIKDG